ncbi:hypothetical protein FDECE_14641 [Fusarium decemcellulare]|nr:hypothetical protein FDECE_14641 [Fusarium decemcellulare]
MPQLPTRGRPRGRPSKRSRAGWRGGSRRGRHRGSTNAQGSRVSEERNSGRDNDQQDDRSDDSGSDESRNDNIQETPHIGRSTRSGASSNGSTEKSSVLQPQNRFERVAFTCLAKDFRESVAAVQKHVDENVPPVTEQEYLQRHMPGHPNPLFDEHWTLQDEAKIEASWDSTVLEQAISRPWSAFPEMRTLWKVSLRRFRKDPLTLFTLQDDDFCFDAECNGMIKLSGRYYTSPIWSKPFCGKLSMIMTHPLWAGRNNWAFMLVVIKWAVICRTDDRHPLKQVDKDVLKWAGCDFASDLPTKPFADHHDDNRKALVEQGGWSTPESDLLAAIATKATATGRDPATTAGSYCVSIQDLTTIIKGLDSINTRGVTVSCEVHFQAFLHSRGGHEWPAGDDLKSLYKSCWFNIERGRARRRRGQQMESDDISTTSSTPIEALEGVPDTTISDRPSNSSRMAPADSSDNESNIAGSDQDSGSDNLLPDHARDKDQEADGADVNGGDENRTNEGVMVDGCVRQVPRPEVATIRQNLDGRGLQLSGGETTDEVGVRASKHRQDEQAMASDTAVKRPRLVARRGKRALIRRA